MNEKLYQKAKEKVYEPLPHEISMYGWYLNSKQCFSGTNRTSHDWGGHQCQLKPKYHIGELQFCTRHAKEIDPTLEGFEKITEPLFTSIRLKVNFHD